jgi:hypothetical protein
MELVSSRLLIDSLEGISIKFSSGGPYKGSWYSVRFAPEDLPKLLKAIASSMELSASLSEKSERCKSNLLIEA